MEDVKPDTTQPANHAVFEGKNSGSCGLSRCFEVRSQDHCSWSADPVNRTGSIPTPHTLYHPQRHFGFSGMPFRVTISPRIRYSPSGSLG